MHLSVCSTAGDSTDQRISATTLRQESAVDQHPPSRCVKPAHIGTYALARCSSGAAHIAGYALPEIWPRGSCWRNRLPDFALSMRLDEVS